MHLLYLDDSGSVGDASQKFFVLAGVSVFERQGHWISQGLDLVASRFAPADPRSVELHGSPMLKGAKGWRNHPRPERVQAIKDALQVFADSPASNRAFAVVVRKAGISPCDPVEFAFEHLVSRFDHFLMRLHKKGDTQRGLNSAQEIAIQRLALDYKHNGHSWGFTRNLAEVPVFLDSRASRLIQLADLVAYATFLKFERQDSRFFDIIAPRFDAAGGVLHGLYVAQNPVEPGRIVEAEPC
jgi:hypothetical protein